MQKSIYVICDDCNKEFCVTTIKKKKQKYNITEHLIDADLVLTYGKTTDAMKKKMEIAKSYGKKVESFSQLNELGQDFHKPKGLNEMDIFQDVEI